MGWWKSQHGVIGDSPADIMGNAMQAIEQAYLREANRLPTQGEIADLLQFCSCGVFDVACGDPKFEFSRQTRADASTPRLRKPGAQGASGKANAPRAGEMGNVDPVNGEHYKAKDGNKVVAQQVKEAMRGPIDGS